LNRTEIGVAKDTEYSDFFEQMIARENAFPSLAFAIGASSLLAASGGPLELEPGQLFLRLVFTLVAYIVFLKLYCRIRDSSRVRLAPAYALAGALMIPAVVTLVSAPKWFGPESVRGADYTTVVGEYRKVPLSDGSSVELNTRSNIRVRYSSQRREIVLQRGEARFSVVHSHNQSFVVGVGDMRFVALGTVFSVRLNDDGSGEVLIEEGRVGNLTGTSVSSVFVAGEQVLFKGGALQRQEIGIEEVQRLSMWTRGMIAFRGAPLELVVHELNRYNGNQIVIDSPQLATISIGGAFHANSPESFLETLHAHFGIQVIKAVDSDGKIIFHLSERPVIHSSGTTLEALAQEFNRYNRNQIVIDSPRLATLSVGGVFGIDDTEYFVKVLPKAQLGTQVRQTVDPDGKIFYHLSEKPVISAHWDTVKALAQEFNRYNRNQIVIDSPRLATLSVSGMFNADDPESFVEALLHAGFGIKAIKTVDSDGKITFHVSVR
jgi:ferric-dicitrate binding protein FerR (iron transport regulator)